MAIPGQIAYDLREPDHSAHDRMERAQRQAVADFWDAYYLTVAPEDQCRAYARERLELCITEVFGSITCGKKNYLAPLMKAVEKRDDASILDAARRFVAAMEVEVELWVKKHVGEGYEN